MDGQLTGQVRGNKFIIKPSKQAIAKYREKLDIIFKKSRGTSIVKLIQQLNPGIRGWVNYYRPFCSRKAFELIDSYLYAKQIKFVKHTHANKSFKWIVTKYFGNLNLSKPNDRWVFGDKTKGLYMLKLRWFTITRHYLLPNQYSPDDPSLGNWFLKRRRNASSSNFIGKGDTHIADKQQHTWTHYLSTLYNTERIEKHYRTPRNMGGPNTYNHLVCLEIEK